MAEVCDHIRHAARAEGLVVDDEDERRATRNR
jgi:hypothetical protein